MTKTIEDKWRDAIYLLRIIAYPRRGGPEETMDIEAAAELIRNKFTRDDLEVE